MNKTISKIKVRYAETDQMGVVHHANYALYLEVGRLEWLSSLGFSYAKMELDGVMLPVVSMSIDFKKPLYFEEEIKLVTNLKSTPSAKIIFEYDLYNQKGELAASASTVLVFVSTETKKPIKCPAELRDAIGNLNT